MSTSFNPHGLGIPDFSTTSISHAQHIPSVPSKYFTGQVQLFIVFVVYQALSLDLSFLGLPVFGRVISLGLVLRVAFVTTSLFWVIY